MIVDQLDPGLTPSRSGWHIAGLPRNVMTRLIGVLTLLTALTANAAVVLPLGTAPQVLIPAAGSTPGANGTFFRSDITIVNLNTHDQQVLLRWLPRAGAGTPTSTTITIPARFAIRSSDFVKDYLNTTGIGAIIVTGVTAAGAPDSSAALDVVSRIWTNAPGTSGTTSQSFFAIPLSAVNTSSAAFFGMGDAENPEAFHENVGIVNVDPVNAQTFAVALIAHSVTPFTIQVTVPPMSMQQVPATGASGVVVEIVVTNITPAATKSNLWTTYCSTVDNITGDAWSELPVLGTGL